MRVKGDRRTPVSSKVGMVLTRIPLLFCFLLLVSPLPSQSQAPSPATAPVTTIPVDVKVVTLPVTVRDKKGKIVRDMTKDDFELEEDSKPQTIRYFSQETNLPLTVGLLVDTSMSERDNIDRERSASRSFLDQMINRPVDRAFVIHFDREIELLQDLTSDHAKLEKAVGLIETQPSVESVPTGDQGSGSHRGGHGAGTKLYDAIFLACDEITKKQTGRKAIVVLTDGEDRGSQENVNSAIESCQKAETVVYTIYIGGHEDRDSGFNGPIDDDDDPMDRRYPGGRYPGGRYPGAATQVVAIPGEAAIQDKGITAPMARKPSSVLPRRPGEGTSRPKRRTRWMTSTPRSPRSCARNSCWAIPRPKTRQAATTPYI